MTRLKKNSVVPDKNINKASVDNNFKTIKNGSELTI